MKKYLVISGIVSGVFAILIVVIFGILVFLDEPPAELTNEEDQGMEETASEADKVNASQAQLAEDLLGIPNDDPERNMKRRSVASLLLEQREIELDTLKAQFTRLNNDYFIAKLAIDSLGNQIAFREGLITGYKKNIEDLNQNILVLTQRKVNIKDIAKTYESMKVNEIRPILGNVDDDTVIALYKSMGSRTRKSIILALSNERAAQITKILAGVNEG